MPLLRNAKKKLRQDKKRADRNRTVKETFRELVKKAKLERTAEAISKAFSAVDKAVKHNLMHKNKAAHMKSDLAKLEGKAPVTALKVIAKAKAKPKMSKTKKATTPKKKKSSSKASKKATKKA